MTRGFICPTFWRPPIPAEFLIFCDHYRMVVGRVAVSVSVRDDQTVIIPRFDAVREPRDRRVEPI